MTASIPFLKSNRVEDIRDVLRRMYQDFNSTPATASPTGQTSRSSSNSFTLSGSKGAKGDTGATGASGVAGKDGANGKDGIDGSIKDLVTARLGGYEPLRLDDDVVSDSHGFLILIRSGDTGVMQDASGTTITE